MNEPTIEQRVRAIIARQFKTRADRLTASTSLFKDLANDSLDIVELVLALEQEFAVQIQDEDLEKLGRLDDLTNYIQAKIASKPDSRS